MAYFAKVVDGIVVEVLAVSNDDAPDPAPENSEALGQAFLESIGLEGEWLQTSFNATFRKHFAAIGYTYDEALDAFIPPKPYESWILNEETCQWEAPIPMPQTGHHMWDTEINNWTEVAE